MMNGKQLYNKTVFKRIQIFFIIVVMAVSFIPEEIIDTYAYEISETEITDTDNTETDNTETDITESELEYQVISASPDEDDSQVITLDGLMPSNAAVSVNSLNEPPEKNLCAYDISISDNNGENFQPQNGSSIKVQITNSNIAEAVASNNKLRLWHIDDDGVREEIHNFTIQDDTITFEASGFSVYEVDDSGPALMTYQFKWPDMDENGEIVYKDYYFPTSSTNSSGAYKEICQQTIKDGETLIFPQLPANNKDTFVGWFVYENGTLSEEPFDFNNVPKVTETKTVELRAVFKSYAYLIFYEQMDYTTGKPPVLATRRAIFDDSGKAVLSSEGITVIYDDHDDNKAENQPAQKVFKGWEVRNSPVYEDDNDAYSVTINGNSYTIEKINQLPDDEDSETEEQGVYLRLYPVFEDIRWLGFDTGEKGSGATYIPPVYFESDEGFSFEGATIPVRAGYEFAGWYTEPNGEGSQVTVIDRDSNTNEIIGQHLVSSLNNDKLGIRNGKLYVEDIKDDNNKLIVQVDLYAKWTPVDSKYTVTIWKQKPTDTYDVNAIIDDRTLYSQYQGKEHDEEYRQFISGKSLKSYDYSESFSIDELTGTNVSVANIYKNLVSNKIKEDYTGFHYADCSYDMEVRGDGKTVLNVYYDRNPHTLKFNVTSGSGWSATTSTVFEKTALYGASIVDIFPIPGYKDYIWNDSGNPKIYDYVLATLETMPNSDVTFTAESRAATRYIYYYVEIDESDRDEYSETRTFNGQLYGLYKTVNHGFYVLTYNEEYHPIEGYKRETGLADPAFGEAGIRANGGNNHFQQDDTAPIGGYTTNRTTVRDINYLYYKRDSFNAVFRNSKDNSIIRDESILYKQKLYKQEGESYVPEPPEPDEGYEFSGWYADTNCTTRVFFREPTQEEIDSIRDANGNANYQVYERMPAYNIQLYAGYAQKYYLIKIDPNGGELADSQSTWFWEPYDGDPISEYNTVTRNYVPDANGTFYYALHDRNYHNLSDEWNENESGLDRSAKYTENIEESSSDIKYVWLPGHYRYLGWYRVNDDGTEEPYNFSERITKNVHLRLHWKQLGTYYIKYDAKEGTIDNGDKNETTFQFLDAGSYEDHADIVVTRVAKPPSGLNFIGWRIKNDSSGTIYYPGQSFQFASSLAEPLDYYNEGTGENETRQTIILEAVYDEIKNASIIYDANGGTISDEALAIANAGGALEHLFKDPNDTQEYSVTADKKQLIVKDLVNNTAVNLSNGKGFSNKNFKFVGWKDSNGNFFNADSITTAHTYADINEPVTLYAQWQTRVYFDKNNGNADWGGDWDSTKYTWDNEKEMYYTVVNLGETVGKPQYTPVSSISDEMFRYWSLNKSGDDMTTEPFNFSQPITQSMLGDNDYLTLYGCWNTPVKIPVHLIDTSDKTWVKHDEWLKNGTDTKIILKDSTSVPLATQNDSYAYADSTKLNGYKWAFACVSKNGEGYTVSEDTLIKSIWYDSDDGKVKVRYSDDSVHDFDTDNDAVYLVYYKDSTININYEYMPISGGFTNITNSVRSEAPKNVDFSNANNNPYNMYNKITKPLYYANNNNYNYQYYSFAVGEKNASSVSDLKVITNYSDSDNERPQLSVRRVWNGFEYSLDGENWNDCGYIDLYVIYYQNLPTVVNLTEKTIAMPENMSDEFEYTVKIKQTETKNIERKYYYKNGNSYTEITNSNTYKPTNTTETETGTVSESTVNLSDSDIEQYVLFYSKPADITSDYIRYGDATYNAGYGNRDVYYRDTTSTEITQTITIVQTPKDNYSTTNDAVSGDHIYNSSYTSSSDSTEKTITYTNKRIPYAELNVAVIENGKITEKNEIRT
ncbi:MAG: InlB B-repeat-containing protein, partial [Ruminococcus sp.]|nr:InlB B-repeat-containing protein [Ruminococcus sp.]